MMVGNPDVFAIESGITQAYESRGLLGLGFFTIHIDGYRYGIEAPDATMLANSFDEVGRRIARRGQHVALFSSEKSPARIADAFRNAYYEGKQEETLLSMPLVQFADCVESARLVWAPDGDEAFDDSSYVLHLDIANSVRLIGFKSLEVGHDPTSLREAWLAADDFYQILQQWRDAFEREWLRMPKSKSVDGAP